MRLLAALGVVSFSWVAHAETPTPAPHHPTKRHAHASDHVATREKLAPPSLVAPITLERPPPPPGLTLAAGTVLVHTAFEMSLSTNSVGAPASIAPDLSIGMNDTLTLSVVHSSSALTGFRGAAGAGICFTGDATGKCRTTYAGGGVEALVSLARGDAAVAANVGFLMTAFDPDHYDLKLGFKSKLTHGTSSLVFTPSVWLPLNDRYNPALPHEQQLWLPVSIWNKLTPSWSLGVGSGLKGPVPRFASRYSIPLGVMTQFALNPRVTVGTSLVFGRVIGGSEVMNPDPGADARVLQMWLAVSSR